MRQSALDRDRVWAAIRTLPTEYVRSMLIDAIDLPPAKLHAVARKYLDLKRLGPDRRRTRKANVLADVKAFEEASLAGEFYDSFDVNSKNFMELDWRTVLPAWFRVLSATAQPEEYAQRTARLLERHYSYGSTKMLGVARKIATPAQRVALGKLRTGARPPRGFRVR